MAISSAICSSFKQELLQGKHSFESSGGHTFKIALYDSDASLGAATTDYSTSEEIKLQNTLKYFDFLKEIDNKSTIRIFCIKILFNSYLISSIV